MAHQLTLLPGDGIGPEVTEATLQVIEAAGVDIDCAVWITDILVIVTDELVLPGIFAHSWIFASVVITVPPATPVASC